LRLAAAAVFIGIVLTVAVKLRPNGGAGRLFADMTVAIRELLRELKKTFHQDKVDPALMDAIYRSLQEIKKYQKPANR
jgi:hypothetical protein